LYNDSLKNNLDPFDNYKAEEINKKIIEYNFLEILKEDEKNEIEDQSQLNE
jgi:hypothetical protein